jgi:hypothetical protein
MSKQGGLIMVLIFFAILFSIQSPPVADPTQCDIAPASSELISQVEAVQEHIADDTPSPSDKPKAVKREIVIFSADWCEPCKQWKRCEQAKFKDAGYTFAYGNPNDVKRLPYFIITHGEKTVEISGYMTLERLAAELAK